jgi:hypothetical protein
MNWKIHVHCRVRNESICYIVFIHRTKPDNSVRINPATRHSETTYGFVILTGDMIFKDFFVGVKLLLRHEHLSSAAANSHQINSLATLQRQSCEAVDHSSTDGRCPLSKTALEGTAKGTHRQCGDGCLPVDPSRSSMAAELIAHATSVAAFVIANRTTIRS